MKKLIPALCMLLVAATLLGTSTYAWFSMNKTVYADGMSVKAVTDESLVIGTTAVVGSDIKVSLSSADIAFTPITYQGGKYQYCTNEDKVDPHTGIALEDETLAFADVPGASNAGKNYYVDYVVYIAAAGKAMQDKTLTATVNFATASTTQKAVSVAFTVLDATGSDIGTQAATLAPDQKVAANGASSVTVNLSDLDLDIPLNTDNQSIPVVMRVYFDGALEESDGVTYVRSEAVNALALTFDVSFTVN